MSERLRQGLQLRNKREIGVGPLKGKDQGERLELSQTHVRSKGHSKRTSSPRAPRESSGRGRSLTLRRIFQAQRQPADRRKGRAGGPGTVPTGIEEPWRDPITTEYTQPKRGLPGKKAPVAAGR